MSSSQPATITAVRKGSPFATGTAKPTAVTPGRGGRSWRLNTSGVPESLGDGVARETATSAMYASVMLVFFTAICCWAFPLGGAINSILGFVMALWGTASRYPRLSTLFLAVHLTLLAVCYLQLI